MKVWILFILLLGFLVNGVQASELSDDELEKMAKYCQQYDAEVAKTKKADFDRFLNNVLFKETAVVLNQAYFDYEFGNCAYHRAMIDKNIEQCLRMSTAIADALKVAGKEQGDLAPIVIAMRPELLGFYQLAREAKSYIKKIERKFKHTCESKI